MTTTLIIILVLVLIALAGWAIAELKYKSLDYQASETEKQAEQQAVDAAREADFDEKGIKEVIETISTKGFKAAE